MKKFIYADKFFLKDGVKSGGYLSIIDGKFGEYQIEKPRDDEIIDCSDMIIAPGFVDTHIHGLLNADIMDNSFEALNKISKGLLAYGVTSFLPTTLTDSIEVLNKSIKNIAKNYDKVEGAKIQGIYLEGPFFTEKYKGAQNQEYFIDPDIEILKKWQNISKGLIKKIALSPERNNSLEFIKYAKENEIEISLGHSAAKYEQVKKAVENGAKTFVHTYNGMSPLNHREPGMVGAAMNLKDTYAELICDGHHVDKIAANILMDIKGRDKIILITDCMRAGGMNDGEYTLGDFPVEVTNGIVRLKNGGLAGSVLTMDKAIRNIRQWGIATLEEAIKMATYIPASSCNIEEKCGNIKNGKPADFIVLDKELKVKATYIDGICKFKA